MTATDASGAHVIGLAGYPGAGKTTFGELLADKFDSPFLTIGDIVRERANEELSESIPINEIIKHNDLTNSKEKELREAADRGEITEELIGNWVTYKLEQNKDTVASWTVDHIDQHLSENPSDEIVLDGVRTNSDIQKFHETCDDFTVVFVTAPFEIRLERLRSRGRGEEDDFTSDDLEARDSREADWGVKDIVSEEQFDHLVVNDGGMDSVKKKVSDIHSELS